MTQLTAAPNPATGSNPTLYYHHYRGPDIIDQGNIDYAVFMDTVGLLDTAGDTKPKNLYPQSKFIMTEAEWDEILNYNEPNQLYWLYTQPYDARTHIRVVYTESLGNLFCATPDAKLDIEK